VYKRIITKVISILVILRVHTRTFLEKYYEKYIPSGTQLVLPKEFDP